jgi:energy-coupling factor transporter ATP-binding protein EcfA2
MAGIEMSTTAAAAKAALELVSVARKQGWFDKLISALRKKQRVLVLGATGTGKTAWLESLTETVPRAIDLLNRTQFIEKYHVKIAKNPFIFTDTPGQELHERRRREAIKQVIQTKGGIAGIINVVAYGYHEASGIAQPEIGRNGQAAKAFLKQRRQIELAMLKEWTPLLTARQEAQWLMTVVTKADLWWPRRAEVLTYYQSGPYYRALGEAQLLQLVVLEYCSVFQKFYGQGLMSGDFQDSDRIRVKAEMLSALLAATGRSRHA